MLCLTPWTGLAQRYSFRDYTQGLGNLAITTIAQDRTGYLWVGTENGLYRYDGQQFRQFGIAEGINARNIVNLYVGPDGTLWVGASPGIYFQKPDGKFAEVRPPGATGEFSQRLGTTFAAISPDRVILASRSGTFLLRRVEPDLWSAETFKLEGQSVWSLLATADGSILYGCDQDLCRTHNGTTTHLGATLGLPREMWHYIVQASDGRIWLRGASHVGELLPSLNRFESRDLPGQSGPVAYAALAGGTNTPVMAAHGSEVDIWQDDHWRQVTERNGLTRNEISIAFADREGSVWIGVAGHGLRRWIGKDHWEAYTAADGLSNDIVWSTLRDRAGRLWIGTETGLDWISAGEHTPKPWAARGVQTNRAYSLTASDDGAIWMGSAVGTVLRIDPQNLTGTQWKVPEVYAVQADHTHRVWIATVEGLFVIDSAAKSKSTQPVIDPVFAQPQGRFSDLCLDAQDRLWAASDQGFFRLDRKGWRRIDPGLTGVNPYLIAAAPDGTIWASGEFTGVKHLRIEGDRIMEAAHFARPSLLSDSVVSMMVDHRGWLWLGQDDGIVVYDGHDWRSFTQEEGLIWNDASGQALYEDLDGSIWIGTSGGLSHLVHPEERSAGAPTRVAFSQFSFGSNTITDGIQIPWSASPLNVSMVSLSFRDARHFRIRYRLLGLETEWVETQDGNVRYPRLSPGNYRLQARVVDDANNNTSQISEIAFSITPRWWQTLLLKLIAGTLIALAAVLLWLWRNRLLLHQKRQLELAVHRRTEDLEREKAELLHAREQMRHFAEHDGLTGLLNHRVVLEHLRREIDRSQREDLPISAILVDIDRFKEINDTFGHQTGDQVLQEVAGIFQRSTRSYDLVGRYGGDEFLLILPNAGFDTARHRAEQMRAEIENLTVLCADRRVPLTSSFGVASGFPSSDQELVQAVDAALYRAKEEGRNRVVSTKIESGERRSNGASRQAGKIIH